MKVVFTRPLITKRYCKCGQYNLDHATLYKVYLCKAIQAIGQGHVVLNKTS